MAAARLILIRHAHRDVMDRLEDNRLSDKGRLQSAAIAEFYVRSLQGRPVRLMSSPKQRCQETLAPLAKKLKSAVEILPILDEQLPDETEQEMMARVVSFIESAREAGDETWLVCSHGDWLPAAINVISNQWVQMKKGSAVEVSWMGDQARVSELRLFGRSTD